MPNISCLVAVEHDKKEFQLMHLTELNLFALYTFTPPQMSYFKVRSEERGWYIAIFLC